MDTTSGCEAAGSLEISPPQRKARLGSRLVVSDTIEEAAVHPAKLGVGEVGLERGGDAALLMTVITENGHLKAIAPVTRKPVETWSFVVRSKELETSSKKVIKKVVKEVGSLLGLRT